MKLRGLCSLLLVVVVLVGVLSWSSYGQKARPSEKVWEYKIVYEFYGENGLKRNLPLTVNNFNEYGSQGWELVSVVIQYDPGEKVFYFKRAK